MKTTKRACGTRKTPAMRCRLLPLLIAGCFGQAAWANPQGAQVVSGQAGFQQQGSVLSVTNTPGAIINWQNFSINAGETTRFIQQSAASAVLNRVVGQDPSKILGTLQSNGKVFLINPNGILFGEGARVDVNGLVASTLNLSNEDFLKGKMNFSSAGTAGAIRNQGTILTPSGGQVYLIAPNIENSGIIHSPKGDVLLAAGHTVQLVDSANPNLQVVVSAPENQALNLGQIITEGGRTGIYGALIRQRGVVSADSAVVGENGRIVFKASRDTLLEAGSVTSATGAGKGGDIQVLGDRVGLMGDARVDASGRTGGGTVLVGGDYKGGNAQVQNAKRAFVSADASIKADAVNAGDGGKVIVWGDETTRVHGSISARGGAGGGDGGFVETSGGYLDVAGIRVDTRAPKGATGTWLLDPVNLHVTNTTTPVGGLTFADNPTTDSYVSATTLNTATSSVVLQATNNINIDEPVKMVSLGAGLVAVAGNDININRSVETNRGDISLRANQSSGNGKVHVNAGSGIVTNGGDVYIEGNGANVYADIVTGGGDVEIHGTNTNVTAGIRSSGGWIDLNGVNLNVTGVLQSEGGWIDIHGTTVNIGGTVQSNSGDIYIDSGAVNIGGAAMVAADGGGDVDIIATGKITNEGNIRTSGYGYVNLEAAKMDLRGTITTADTGKVELFTWGRVELGATDSTDSASGTVQLKDTELDTIRTGALRIYGINGIHVSNPISVDQSNALVLIADNGDITQNVSAPIAARALALDARSVDLQAPNQVGVIAGEVTGDFKYRTVNKLTIKPVDEYYGVEHFTWSASTETTGASAATSTGTSPTIFLQSDSALGIDQDAYSGIFTDGATLVLRTPGSVRLNGYANQIDKLAVSAGGGVEVFSDSDMRVSSSTTGIAGITAGGDVRLRVGYEGQLVVDQQINAGSNHVEMVADRLALNAMVHADEASVRPWSYGRSITVGQANCAVADCLLVNNLHRIAARTIGIGRDPLEHDEYYEPHYGYDYGYAGPIHVGGITNTGTGAISDRNSATRLIGLLSNEGVTQSGAIEVEGLGVLAGGDVVLNHAGNKVSRVFGASMDGSFSFSNVGPLTIGAPLGLDVDYDAMGVWAPYGEINISNIGHLQVASNASLLTDTGAIRLTAHSPLTVDGIVSSVSGTIALEAADSGSPQDVLTINGLVATGGFTSLKAGAGMVINGTVMSANFSQTGGAPVHSPVSSAAQQAANTVVNTIVQATQAVADVTRSGDPLPAPGDKEEKKEEKAAAADKNDGAKKNDSGKKLYCN